MKKLIFLAVSAGFVVLVAGGFFYWWQNQADVRELNKTLPDGVRVVKSLIGNEYGVVNKLDEYNFRVPINQKSWNKMGKVEYKDLTNEGLGYRLSMDRDIQEAIKSESVLIVTNPNDMTVIEISSLHFSTNISLDKFAEDFKSKFTPPRSGATIEINPKIDDILINGLRVLKLSEVSKSSRVGGDITTPLFYLFNADSTIYVIPLDLNDYLVDEIFINGKW